MSGLSFFHRDFHEVQRQRQQLQARALTQIQKYQARVRDSLVRRALCEAKYEEVRLMLLKRGVKFGAEAGSDNGQVEGQEGFSVDVSLTEREYANVRVSGGDDDNRGPEQAVDGDEKSGAVDSSAVGTLPSEEQQPPEKEELEEVGHATTLQPLASVKERELGDQGATGSTSQDAAQNNEVVDSVDPEETGARKRGGRKRKSSPPPAEPLTRKSSRRK